MFFSTKCELCENTGSFDKAHIVDESELKDLLKHNKKKETRQMGKYMTKLKNATRNKYYANYLNICTSCHKKLDKDYPRYNIKGHKIILNPLDHNKKKKQIQIKKQIYDENYKLIKEKDITLYCKYEKETGEKYDLLCYRKEFTELLQEKLKKNGALYDEKEEFNNLQNKTNISQIDYEINKEEQNIENSKKKRKEMEKNEREKKTQIKNLKEKKKKLNRDRIKEEKHLKKKRNQEKKNIIETSKKSTISRKLEFLEDIRQRSCKV